MSGEAYGENILVNPRDAGSEEEDGNERGSTVLANSETTNS